MSSAYPFQDLDLFSANADPDWFAADQGPSSSELLASIEPVQRTTSIGQLEAIAANLEGGAHKIPNNRLLVEWLIENPDLARRRIPHAAQGAESSPMLRKLPDDVLQLVLDELEDHSQHPTTDLLTTWSRLEDRRVASRCLELEALSLVCRRLSRLALPRLRREMWHELRPLPDHPRLAHVHGYADAPSSRSLVWIKGIEHSQARNSIKHLYLVDHHEAEVLSGTSSLVAPSDLAMLLNILSDNLQVLVLKGGSVRAFFQAIDTEPLTHTHMIHTLKLHLQHPQLSQPVRLEWLLLCCQRFGKLSRLTCAFDKLLPSGAQDDLGWKPTTAFTFPRERIAHLELNLTHCESSLAALAELVCLNTHSLETLSLRGRFELMGLADGPITALGALLAPTGIRKLGVALEFVVERGFFTRDHGPHTTLGWIQGLFEARLARLRTLALTFSVALPVTLAMPPVSLLVPLLQGLWGSALLGSPQLTTVIVRTTAKTSMGLPLGIDTPVPLVPPATAPFRRLGVALDIPEGRPPRRYAFEDPDLASRANERNEQIAKLKDWCLNRGDTQWIEHEPSMFKADGRDLYRYF